MTNLLFAIEDEEVHSIISAGEYADQIFTASATRELARDFDTQLKDIITTRLINLIHFHNDDLNWFQELGLLAEETFAKVSQAITELRAIDSIEDAIQRGAKDIYVGFLYDLLKNPSKITELRKEGEESFIKTLNHHSQEYPILQDYLHSILSSRHTLLPIQNLNLQRFFKQVVRTGNYLKKIPQEKINELVIQIPELTDRVKGLLAIKAKGENWSESKLSDGLINKLKLALDYYNKVGELEAQIRGEMEGIMVEPLDKILEDYRREDYTQLTPGSMFRKNLEYYHTNYHHTNYQDLREGLAKILSGNFLLTTEEKTELITTAKTTIKLGDYIQTIEPKTLALHMRQNSDIYKLVKELSVLKLSQELEKQLNKAIEIYNIMDEIDNDQALAEALGIELSKIPPVKVIEDNTTKEDKPMAEWLEEQFIANNNSQEQDNAGNKNDDKLELEAKEKGIPDLVPDNIFSSQVEVIPASVNEEDYSIAPIGEAPFTYDAG